MKKLIPFLILFASGCDLITEEIEIEKLIYDTVYLKGDSVPVPVFIDRVRIDSIPYPVFVNDTIFVPTIVRTIQVDTIYLPGETITDIDTVFVEKIVETTVYDTIVNTVYVHDTISVVSHHYHDTLFVYPGFTTYWVPEQLQEIVSQFYADALAWGLLATGGEFIIEWWLQSEFPPASRSSYFYNPATNPQPVIKLKDTLTPDELYSPIYREMMHWQFGTPYSTDVNSIMSPDFSWTRLKYSDSDEKKKPYLDALFSKEPI